MGEPRREGEVMEYFYAVVHKDADSAFGVSFPDLPGCFSAADRQEEILPNAAEALKLWLGDGNEAQPRSIELVREEVKNELAQGAFILAVPRMRTKFEPGHGYTQEDWDAVSDNPEWTEEDFANAKPFAEIFPEWAASIKRDLD